MLHWEKYPHLPLFRNLAHDADSFPAPRMVLRKIFASIKIVASLPGRTTISYGSRDGSKIMRRIISGYEREIFPRIRWTGERCTSSSLSDNDRVLLRGVTTGVLDSSVTLVLVLIAMREYKHLENINPAYLVEHMEYSPGT